MRVAGLRIGFDKSTKQSGKLVVMAFLLLFLVLLVVGLWENISDAYSRRKFDNLSSAEHLRVAVEMCRNRFGAASDICFADDPTEAARHLEKIPSIAPEHEEAAKLLAIIQKQQLAHKLALEKEQNQATQRAVAEQPTILQAKRDEDAQFDSYWPTTLRVDTDMDSFWLLNEERVCQTFPDDKGRVSVVSCNATGSHRDHNIPVRFWGGVDRNTISSWKCRRESDEFVCRAIN